MNGPALPAEWLDHVEYLEQGPRRRRGRLLDEAKLRHADGDGPIPAQVKDWLFHAPNPSELPLKPSFMGRRLGNILHVLMIPLFGNILRWLDMVSSRSHENETRRPQRGVRRGGLNLSRGPRVPDGGETGGTNPFLNRS